MYNENSIIYQINTYLTPQEILESRGYKINEISKTKYQGQALHKGDSENSLSINHVNNLWLWYDFRNDIGGTTYKLLEFFHGNNKESIISEYESLTGREIKKSLSNMDDDSEKVQQLLDKISYWNNIIFEPKNEDYLNYLLNRGFTIDYIKSRKIGLNEWYSKKHGCTIVEIVFPFFDVDGIPKTFISRNVNNNSSINIPKYRRDKLFSAVGTYETLPYNLDTAIFKNEVVLTEGTIDSDMISMYSNKGTIAVSGNGTSKETWESSIIPAIRNKKVTLILDNDSSALKQYRKDIKLLLDHGIYDFKVAVVPKNKNLVKSSLINIYESHFDEDIESEIKDINDYYLAYNDLKGIFNTSRHWLYYYTIDCIKNNDISRLEKVLIDKSRFINQSELLLQLDYLKADQVINEELFKLFKKIITRPPLQSFIVNEITNKHKLLYHRTLDFVEFNGKVWQMISDSRLHNYINKELGEQFMDGRLLSPITKLVRSKVEINKKYPDIFNKKEIMVFQNGTLDLKTGTFTKSFNPNDYVTNIVSYNYVPNAQCDKWLNFLNEVCEVKGNPDDTQRKIDLLQEFAGYILFSDCNLQSALILQGEGSNGKSVFFSIISEVFKDVQNESVTYIDISSISKSFHSIALKDSILNITGEAKTSLRGSEEKLKNIIAGETITDSYKGKDLISFTPRAKYIIAVNNGLLPEDKSDGTVRRFLVVEFQNKFSNNPKEGEKKKNPYLVDELKSELSGIFNWCFEGYKRLKETKRFTETQEHRQAIETMKDDVNPIRLFLKSRDDLIERIIFYSTLNDPIKIKDEFAKDCIANNSIVLGKFLFSRYQDYCNANNFKEANSRNFGKELRRALDSLGFTFETVKTRKGLGYRNIKKPRYWCSEDDNLTSIDNYLLDEEGNPDRDFMQLEVEYFAKMN